MTSLFISYAWGAPEAPQHREWVRLLAAHLKAIGYDVLIDADVNYGDSLSGFMRRAMSSDRVLMIVDEDYAYRADNLPKSGVGVENAYIRDTFEEKPSGWLAVLLHDNPARALPAWLEGPNLKYFNFNTDPTTGEGPGSEQVEDLWRWVEGLPASREHQHPVAVLRERARRLEDIDQKRDPNHWKNPSLEGTVHFDYSEHRGRTFTMGHGEYTFALSVSERGWKSLYAYSDGMKAVGIIRADEARAEDLTAHLTAGRIVEPVEGETVLIMNNQGALCEVRMDRIQGSVTGPPYQKPFLDFTYKVLREE